VDFVPLVVVDKECPYSFASGNPLAAEVTIDMIPAPNAVDPTTIQFTSDSVK
jgi:hypothetical protein